MISPHTYTHVALFVLIIVLMEFKNSWVNKVLMYKNELHWKTIDD